MRTYEELKQLLTQVKDNDYKIPDGVNLDDLIADMLKFIGHTDYELRDALIYSTFCTWVDNNVISTEQMRHMLITCLGEDYLFFGIGERDTDSVFTRSFSSLVIALAFCVQDETPFLTEADILNIKDALIRYIGLERDYRGYIVGKGWAHAVAHIADALANTAGADKIPEGKYVANREVYLEFLGAVKLLVCNKDMVYVAEEDERLTGVVFASLSNEVLATHDVMDWLKSFEVGSYDWKTAVLPDDYNIRVNKKHFMRSLYFGMLSCKDDEFDEVSVREVCEYMKSILVDSD